jgi:antitoxin ParD1/3/4
MTPKNRPADATERLTVALPGRLARSVRKAVKAGEYASTSEVVHEALRLWEGRRELRARALTVLRRAWDEGKASGRAGELDIARLIAEEKSGGDLACEGAGRMLDEHERLLLTGGDREAFLKAVLNPPKPAKRLVNALRRHRQIVG